jgi:hypothetical protein
MARNVSINGLKLDMQTPNDKAPEGLNKDVSCLTPEIKINEGDAWCADFFQNQGTGIDFLKPAH